VPVIGLLSGIDPDDSTLDAIQQGLKEAGYVVGGNVAIESLSAAGQYDRLPALAAELVRRRVAVIYANALPAAIAARAATATIPIVFTIGGDPIRDGLVTSLNRPTGNLTGVTFFAGELLPKRMELLRQVVPAAEIIAVLVDPNNPNLPTRLHDVQEAARSLGQQIIILYAGTERDIDAAFASIVQQRAAALLVTDDPFLQSRQEQIVALAARHLLPACYFVGSFVRLGGLLSYGDNRFDSIRQVGRYVGRILKGEKLSDLPVLQPTKLELKINLRTARSLGLNVPATLLATADEVIE
jgi:putative ABC transport system substrate-binding protein